ncbi:hypothetical protein TA3x_000316 [Tundrisphaera sp. TA3]|uniref:hypothetical protein n=1 Tax=Tundrisphaera sp. TA3 TaxID=3435775 RepID=UPI003EBE533B
MGNDNLAVTLTPALFEKLSAEAKALDVPLEWLVASLVLDTFETPGPKPLRTAA